VVVREGENVSSVDPYPLEPAELPSRQGKDGRAVATVGDFLRRGEKVMRVDFEEGRKAVSVAACMRQAIKHAKAGHLMFVCQRRGEVYLVRILDRDRK
jgi:hypothetical protein